MKRVLMAIALLLVASGWLVQGRSSVVAEAGAGDRHDLGGLLLDLGYLRVPMLPLPTGHYAIEGTAGTVSLNLIVDTGASHTVIDVARADRFDLRSEDRGSRATGIGVRAQRVESGHLEDVVIGEVQFDTLRVTVIDLSQVNGVLRRMGTAPVDGIIGADVLLAQRAVIDYGVPALYFRESGSYLGE